MRYRIFFLLILILLNSCLKENVGTVNSKDPTFVRYYNSGFTENPVCFEKTNDNGNIILSTLTISPSANIILNSIKLTKTNDNGISVWNRTFPDVENDKINYSASQLINLPNDGGYLIVGNDINIYSDGIINGINRDILVIVVDLEGNKQKSKTLKKDKFTTKPFGRSVPTYSYNIVGVSINKRGNFVLVATFENTTTPINSQLFACELGSSDLEPVWNRYYNVEELNAKGNMMLDENDVIVYVANRLISDGNITGIRFMKIPQDYATVDYDLTLVESEYGTRSFNSTESDFCSVAGGYAILGSSNKKLLNTGFVPSDHNVMFKLVSENGTEISTVTYSLDENDNANDYGTAISPTTDGGFIILASVNSASIEGRGELDYLIIKTDPFGNEQWRSTFGSRFDDVAVSIKQANDGGYIILGTSTQGGIVMTSLVKTDSHGKLY